VSGRPLSQPPSYRCCFAAQVGALGRAGQGRLRQASVLVVGLGGIGTSVSSVLAMAGIGKLVLVDPQLFAVENLNRCGWARPTDIGKPKVDVVTAGLLGRPHLEVLPFIGRAEDLDLEYVAAGVQLVVASSNTITSRIAAARLAVGRGLIHVSGALMDGREALGGLVTAWVPEARELACPACFLATGLRVGHDESIMATVASAVGSIAASVAVQLLARPDSQATLRARANASLMSPAGAGFSQGRRPTRRTRSANLATESFTRATPAPERVWAVLLDTREIVESVYVKKQHS
jgi:molybdopterin/thiamine biosynthesis adenylyltransferase